jgi:hypothetical protein
MEPLRFDVDRLRSGFYRTMVNQWPGQSDH